ncbi:unnamed protein product, partial [Mesorhabditis spiculigera]
MWKIVEAAPKKYESVPFDTTCNLGFGLSDRWFNQLAVSELPREQCQTHPPSQLVDGPWGEETRLVISVYMKLLLSNATIDKLKYPPLHFGNQFWFSLNMRVNCIFDPRGLFSAAELLEFIDHFKPKAFVCSDLTALANYRSQIPAFLTDPIVRSLEKVDIGFPRDYYQFAKGLRAKDLVIRTPARHGCALLSGGNTPVGEVLAFFEWKITAWLDGTDEIEKFFIYNGPVRWNDPEPDDLFGCVMGRLKSLLTPNRGRVEQMSNGFDLIVREFDGQSLLVYSDDKLHRVNFLRTEYNFRMSRSPDSLQTNDETLASIIKYMHHQRNANPQLAAEARERLKEECAKFIEYNKEATNMDLIIETLLYMHDNPSSRPEYDRAWAMCKWDRPLEHVPCPVKTTDRHAYEFARAFESSGKLPNPDDFEPYAYRVIFVDTSRARRT